MIFELFVAFLVVLFFVSRLHHAPVSKDPSVRTKMLRPQIFASDYMVNTKLNSGQGAVIVLLMFSLLAICERILFDLSRILSGPNYDYFDNLQTIMVHALFIIPVLVAFIVVNMLVGQSRQKYAVILAPYLVTTIILTFQLIVEIGVYFSNHHTELQLNFVLLCIVFISSYTIWYVQGLYSKKLEEMRLHPHVK